MLERSKFAISLLVLVLVLLAGAASQADAQNMVGDFSPSSNPTGNWSYGFTSTLGGTFNLFTTSSTVYGGLSCDGTVNTWSPSLSGVPVVGHNPSGMTVTCSTVRVPNDVLAMHPDTSGAEAVVRWTAPGSGTYATSTGYLW